MQNSFKRYFKNNNEYPDFKDIIGMGSLAYTVQEFLYSEKAKNEYGEFYMDRHIKLYDLMNMVIPFIKASQSDFGLATIKGYIHDLKKKKRAYQSGELVEETKDGYLLVSCASQSLIVAVLWTAYIYICFCSFLIVLGTKQNVKQLTHAIKTLESLMREEMPYRQETGYDFSLVKITPDANKFIINHWEEYIRLEVKTQQTENSTTQTADDQHSCEINDEQKVQNEQLKEENLKLVMENQKLKAELKAVKQKFDTHSPDTNSNEWISCFDGFLHPNLNPQAIAKALKNISHSNFPKNERGYWWTFVTVLTELNWIPKQNYKLVLQWANLHFNCGWDWTKDSQFKFSDINEKIKSTQPSSKWNRKVTGNVIGHYYGELAKNMKAAFVEEVEGGKIIDRAEFFKSGTQRINQGR